MNRVYLLLLISAATIFSCISSSDDLNKKDIEAKNENLLRYLTENHSIGKDELEDKIVLIIPVNSCTPCVRESFEIADYFSVRRELLVLLIYDFNKELYLFKDQLDKLMDLNVRIIRTAPSDIFSYHITGGSPRLYILIDGELDYIVDISKENKESTINYINRIYSANSLGL